MSSDSHLGDIVPVFVGQKDCLSQILDKDDFGKLLAIKEELQETWQKRQIYRTETEMRVSVLNDINHPTRASKYWQCVREQSAFFEMTIEMSFEYRANEVEIKKIQRQMESETDELELELLQIELEKKLYRRTGLELTAKDRIRELDLWSKLKKELDDGSFDTQNVGTHQMESLKKTLEQRAKAISPSASPSDINNIMGPLMTLQKIEKNDELKLKAGN